MCACPALLMRTGAIQYLGVGGSSMRSVVRVVLGLTYTRHGHSRVSCPAAEEGLECRRCYLIFGTHDLIAGVQCSKDKLLNNYPYFMFYNLYYRCSRDEEY